jgi:hypothetical protein
MCADTHPTRKCVRVDVLEINHLTCAGIDSDHLGLCKNEGEKQVTIGSFLLVTI